MLLYTMSPREAKTEWEKDKGQLFPKKLTKWYKNVGKSIRLKTKFPAFYKYEMITKRNNKRYMLVRFESYAEYLIGRNLRVEYSIVNAPNGCRAYIMNYDSDTMFIYSAHCIKRYSQRWAKGLHNADCVHQMIKDNLDAKNLKPFFYENQVIVRGTYGLFFGKMLDEDICLFTTFVDNDQLFDEQVATNEYMKDCSVQYLQEYRGFIDNLSKSLMKIL